MILCAIISGWRENNLHKVSSSGKVSYFSLKDMN